MSWKKNVISLSCRASENTLGYDKTTGMIKKNEALRNVT